MQTLRARESWSSVGMLVVGLVLAGLSGAARAQTTPMVTSDEPAGYLVFPKVIVDTSGVLSPQGLAVDTIIQLTNTDLDASCVGGGDPPCPIADGSHAVICWYVDATSTCSNAPGTACEANADCPRGGLCVPQWGITNFEFILTPGQPVAWRVSTGEVVIPCASPPCDFLPCDPSNPDPSAQACLFENTSPISFAVSRDPFHGELKCVEVTDLNDPAPLASNDLKGEATIYHVRTGPNPVADSAVYNAIGFQALTSGVVAGTPDSSLCLGGAPDITSTECPTAEYAACPAVLILDHYFDGATNPVNGLTFATDLTLAPCSEDMGAPLGGQVTVAAQMLVYNEFEQRFSTSTRVACYEDVQLSDIDTRLGALDDAFSVFSVGVQGTLTGQTRIRGADGGVNGLGSGLLGVALARNEGAGVFGAAAFNLNYFGERTTRDVVRLELP